MKALKKAAVIFFFSLFLCIQVSAAEYGWFFKSGASGEQPSVMDGSSLPDRYGCLYLGSRATRRFISRLTRDTKTEMLRRYSTC